MKALLAIACSLLIAAPLAWVGGELHRENCQHQGNRGCSVLPWDGGQKVKAGSGWGP